MWEHLTKEDGKLVGWQQQYLDVMFDLHDASGHYYR